MRERLLGLSLTAGMLLAATGCDRGPARRDVLLVTIDTLRADRLGCYGNRDGLTPGLDRLAGGAVLFEQAMAAAPITLPSHASLLTGRDPTATGVRNNGTFILSESERTLAELLHGAGWSTAAVIAAYPLHRRFGLAQGFERYDDHLPPPPLQADAAVPFSFAERQAREVTDRAAALWKEMGPAPRFLWVHYFDPHAPYRPPEAALARAGGRPYDGEVAYVDEQLARLLQVVEAASPEAVIVIASDHGESLGEHDENTHGLFVYQSTLHVPLLMRAKGLLPEGTRVREPVSLVDVLPTILALVGVEAPGGLDGIDLVPRIEGGSGPPRALYAESFLPRYDYRFSELTAIREGDLKYIDAPLPELYDLAADPEERHNLHGSLPEEARLAGDLAAITAAADPEATRRAQGRLDPEAIARLRSLGYVAGGPPAGPANRRGPDPKTMTGWVRRHERAMRLAAEGRTDAAIALLQELLREMPDNDVARYELAGVLVAAGRAATAEPELRAVVDRDPEFFDARVMLGDVQAQLGKLEEAVRQYRVAASLRPELAGPEIGLAKLFESHERPEEAAEAYKRALRIEPWRLDVAESLLKLRRGADRPERAIEELRALVGDRPDSPALWTALAQAHRRAHDPAEARRCAERALELDPDFDEARLALGQLRLAAGDAAGAERTFRELVDHGTGGVGAEFGLVRALLADKRDADADAELARLLDRHPRFFLGWLLHAGRLEHAGKRQEAADAYRRALELHPDDARALEGLRRVSGGAGPGAEKRKAGPAARPRP